MRYKRLLIGASLITMASLFFSNCRNDKEILNSYVEPNYGLNELIEKMPERDKVYFIKNSMNSLSDKNKALVSKYVLDDYVKYNSDFSSRLYVVSRYFQGDFGLDRHVDEDINEEALKYLGGVGK